MSYTDVLKIIPTMQSLALAGHNYSFVKKKKKSMEDFLYHGTENIVGTSLIKDTAQFIE